MRGLLGLMGIFIFTLNAAQAVVVAGGDGTQNTTAPSGGQGWDYVGQIIAGNGAPSGVTYLDNNWFITAYHVQVLDNPTGVLLGGLSYSIDAGSWTRLNNSVGGDADLAMFRVTSSVGLSALTVRSSSLANGSALTMVGNGRNRETDLTRWNSSWTEVPFGGTYSGYKWTTESTKRWGTNTKEASVGLINTGLGSTDMFDTNFDNTGDQAQGATYDSGGGVFVDNAGNWELAGIMVAVSGFSGQPASTSVFGNKTYSADLSFYADQIATTVAIPEPSILAFGFILPAAFYVRRIFLI